MYLPKHLGLPLKLMIEDDYQIFGKRVGNKEIDWNIGLTLDNPATKMQ